MSKNIFKKTVDIGGVEVALTSIDGRTWSSSLADLERHQAEGRMIRAEAQRAFRRIGDSDRWGLGQGRKRRAG